MTDIGISANTKAACIASCQARRGCKFASWLNDTADKCFMVNTASKTCPEGLYAANKTVANQGSKTAAAIAKEIADQHKANNTTLGTAD